VSFQDKVKIKQISFDVSVEHPTKNTDSNSREAFIRVKWFKIIFCSVAEEI